VDFSRGDNFESGQTTASKGHWYFFPHKDGTKLPNPAAAIFQAQNRQRGTLRQKDGDMFDCALVSLFYGPTSDCQLSVEKYEIRWRKVHYNPQSSRCHALHFTIFISNDSR